jgi:hypothetical protein
MSDPNTLAVIIHGHMHDLPWEGPPIRAGVVRAVCAQHIPSYSSHSAEAWELRDGSGAWLADGELVTADTPSPLYFSPPAGWGD